MYLIGDMTARTRLTPSSYSSSKVVRAGEVRIPCCGPRTAELLVDPILSRTHPHCSGSSDHPRLRLHLTPPCSLVLFVRKWFKQQSCAERIHGSLSFMATAHLRSLRCLIIPCNGFVFRPLSCISVIRGPGHRWLVLCFCDLWILMELSWPFTFLPRNSSQFACASNVPGPAIGYSRWKRSTHWLSLLHRFFET